ncbi:Arylsulfotransferase-domain-containing protein [Xylaria sp. FL0043]|nr:Arylsulfotransferase-domain-containing protein [Xylaria sp. FL0043]
MTRILQWLLLAVVASDVRAWAYDVFGSSLFYELGFYGLYPTTTFKSTELTAPLLNFPQWDEQKCGDGYYLIAQKGKLVSDTGPTILNSRGELVWADDSYGVVFNLQIQIYKGEHYITFWSSPEGSTHGYGRGTYYMLDSSYQLFRKFEAAGEGLKGDLHEFQITEHGTALITIYNPIPADLTSIGGPEQGWALDSMFQEIDIATGELLFEWSAIEHVALSHGLRTFAGEDDGTTPETAFDYFHINSVDVDGDGNYVISGRHTSTIVCIDRHSGTILWTLGGLANDFTDLSDGRATDFMYQHHARLHANQEHNDNHTLLLSIFDNAAAERAGAASQQPASRGVLLRLDTANRTAALEREFLDAAHPTRTAVSQGSMQVLEDRVVLGYGWLPFITEFALDDGAVVCAAELAPWVAARWGLVNTYRAFKARHWTGRPAEPPAVYLDPADARVFVSWNGATEVERWVLQGADWTDLVGSGGSKGRSSTSISSSTTEESKKSEKVERTETASEADAFVDLDILVKDSFETSFDILDDMPRYLRVAAIDKEGNVLRHSQIVDRKAGNASGSGVRDAVVWCAVLLSLAVAVLLALGKRGRKAILGNSSRACEMLARACRERIFSRSSSVAVSASIPSDSGHEQFPRNGWRRGRGRRWWPVWGAAKAHELQPLYHD